MVSLALGIVGSLIAALLWAELEGWGPRLGRRLLEFGVRKLPEERRSRYLEEWCAHQDDMPTPLSKLLVGLGFAVAGYREGVRVRHPRWLSSLAREALIRGCEIGVSSLALVMFAPLLVVVAIAIRLETPGPVIFKRVVIGRNGVRFSMYKFRTMRIDHERAATQGSSSRDPRVTKVGWILRKTSLDELPQLFNVLWGSMSLVGPRPRPGVQRADGTKPGIAPALDDTSGEGGHRSVRSYFRALLQTVTIVFFGRF